MNYLSKFEDIQLSIQRLISELNESDKLSYGVEFYTREASNCMTLAKNIFKDKYVESIKKD